MKPGGGIALTAPNGLALFLKRSPDSRRAGEWNFPGGHVEEGETAESAARRETHEETGYRDSKPLREIARTPIDDEGEGEQDEDFHPGLEDYVTFQGKVDRPFTPKLDGESSAYAWAPIDQPPEPLHPGVRDALKQLVAKDQADEPSLSKTTARYVYPAPDPDNERCGICSMFRTASGDDPVPGAVLGEEGRCTLVIGTIEPFGTCEHFDPDDELVAEYEEKLAGDSAPVLLAFDRSPERMPATYRRNGLAFDYASARSYDSEGRLHVNPTNISKGNICPYRGDEIPDADKLGLDPERVYQLLRDPDELERASSTFNRLPVLSEHVPVSADDHQPDLVIGATGSDATFEPPYLRNSLVIWAKPAIDEIEREEKKQLSSAYRYRADMTPGIYQGVHYDGVMRDIIGNHVALVKEGRAGDDVVVGDSKQEPPMAAPIQPTSLKLTRKGTLAFGMLSAFLKPRLAQDAKLDLASLLKDVRRKTFAQDKGALFNKISAAINGKLAKDASVDGLASILDMIEAHEPESQDAEPEATPQPLVETTHDDGPLPAFLKEKLSGDDYSHAMDLLHGPTPGRGGDQEMKPLSTEGPKPGGRTGPLAAGDEEEKEEKVDKKAMDKAIEKAVKIAKDSAAKTQREIREAERFVRPWVGELNMAFDSADAVFKTTLDSLGIKTEGVHPSAFKTILEQIPQPGRERRERPNLAQDGANSDSFYKMFPEASRIGML